MYPGLSSLTTHADLLETMNISATNTLIETATSTQLYTDTLPTSIAMTTSATTPATTESPLQRHLSLIIGIPTGIGLSIVGLLLCLIWLACSSYCDYRKSLPQQGTAGSAGTRSTNMQVSKLNQIHSQGGKNSLLFICMWVGGHDSHFILVE